MGGQEEYKLPQMSLTVDCPNADQLEGGNLLRIGRTSLVEFQKISFLIGHLDKATIQTTFFLIIGLSYFWWGSLNDRPGWIMEG